MQNKSKSTPWLTRTQRVIAIFIIIFLAGAGLRLLSVTRAATPFISADPENGTVTSPATAVSDASASGGKYVKFAAAGSGNPNGGCASGGVSTPCIGNTTTGQTGWGTPVFVDEFNGTALDTNKWSPCWFTPTCGSMNNVKTNPSNVKVTGGSAVLTLASSSSGALISSDPNGGAGTGFQFGAGYYAEARVYFPGSGTTIYNWPAWWLTGQNWPATGENDIAEGLGTMTVNYHSSSGSHNQGTVPGTWSNAYHIYGVYRQATKCDVYYDGKLVKSYATDDGGAPEYLVFNAGSGYTAQIPSQLKVDYARVWKK